MTQITVMNVSLVRKYLQEIQGLKCLRCFVARRAVKAPYLGVRQTGGRPTSVASTSVTRRCDTGVTGSDPCWPRISAVNLNRATGL